MRLVNLVGMVSASGWCALVLLAGCDTSHTVADGSTDRDAACTPSDCDDGLFCNGVERCEAAGCASGDAPCANGCDETSDTCGCEVPDADGDGHLALGCGGDDCDDSDGDRHPGVTEVCDAADIDEDCDPATFGDRDGDLDGHLDARCCNGSVCGDDCDDARADVHEGLLEACDSGDNDCDGAVDEGVSATLYRDGDGDGHGAGAATLLCADTPGYATSADDCDDANVNRYPGATELCADGIDNNCDGRIDESGPRTFYRDADGDGYGTPSDSLMTVSCTPPAGYAGNSRDCDDQLAAVNPDAMELCNGRDDDCSSGGGVLASEDADGDAHSTPTAACTGGYPNDDCDDTRASVYPGAPELCDGRDNDCASGGGAVLAEDMDGDTHAPPSALCAGGFARDDCDDADSLTFGGAIEICDRRDNNCSSGGGIDAAEDIDNDGHSAVAAACAPGPFLRDDCDDTRTATYPGAIEVCNLIDDNCVGGTDEGVTVTSYADRDGDGHGDPRAALTACSMPAGYVSMGDDCDDASPTVYPGAALEAPRLLGPENGALTGSLHAAGTLRPTFRWRPGTCTGTHDIEVDDSCATPGFEGCTFPSPEVQSSVAGTSSSLATDLPVSSVAPVGQRYYWRVRACDGATCGPWSAVRYIDIGRTPNDFNGDGYSDVVAGADNQNAGATSDGNVFVFHGSAAGVPASPSVTLDNPASQIDGFFGRSVASAGDVNGDGYADLVVGAAMQDAGATDEGNAFVYYGSAAGVPTSPSVTLDNPANQATGAFGVSVASAGDVNGDGYADLVVGAYFQNAGAADEGNAFVYHGSPTGVPASPSVTLENPANQTLGRFGQSVASAGDVNGDGYADIVVGAYAQDAGATDEGNAFVYHGSTAGVPASPNVTLDNPANQGAGRFGISVASAGDVNRDGYADIVVGAYWQDRGATDEGNAFVYYGRATGVPAIPNVTLDNPANQMGGSFARSVASAGDVNGDGYADLVIGAYWQDAGATDEGNAFVYHGSAAGVAASPNAAIDNPANQASGWFGLSVASAGARLGIECFVL